MTYSPPYIYTGLYEEESKAFEIVSGIVSEPLWRESKASLQQERLDGGAFGARLSVMHQVQLRASMRDDGSGVPSNTDEMCMTGPAGIVTITGGSAVCAFEADDIPGCPSVDLSLLVRSGKGTGELG